VRKKGQGRKKVAAREKWRVGVKNCQVQERGTSIYRHGLGLGFLIRPNGLGRAGPNTKLSRDNFFFILFYGVIGMLIISRNKNAPVDFVCTKNRAK
jgi:hypothetical protein